MFNARHAAALTNTSTLTTHFAVAGAIRILGARRRLDRLSSGKGHDRCRQGPAEEFHGLPPRHRRGKDTGNVIDQVAHLYSSWNGRREGAQLYRPNHLKRAPAHPQLQSAYNQYVRRLSYVVKRSYNIASRVRRAQTQCPRCGAELKSTYRTHLQRILYKLTAVQGRRVEDPDVVARLRSDRVRSSTASSFPSSSTKSRAFPKSSVTPAMAEPLVRLQHAVSRYQVTNLVVHRGTSDLALEAIRPNVRALSLDRLLSILSPKPARRANRAARRRSKEARSDELLTSLRVI